MLGGVWMLVRMTIHSTLLVLMVMTTTHTFVAMLAVWLFTMHHGGRSKALHRQNNCDEPNSQDVH